MAKESRNPNESGKHPIVLLSFWHSSFIRHSSFVLRHFLLVVTVVDVARGI